MRLLKFLKESQKIDPDQIFDTIWDNCQPFLKMLKIDYSDLVEKNFHPLYRGISFDLSEPLKKFDMRTRSPKGTKEDYFKAINLWLKRNNFATRDNSVFAISDEDEAGKFGMPYAVFPIGPCKYSYVASTDWNEPEWDHFGFCWVIRDYLKQIPDAITIDEFSTDKTLKIIKKFSSEQKSHELISIKTFSDVFNWDSKEEAAYNEWEKRGKKVINEQLSNHDLKFALENSWEVWFNCKSYYLMDPDIWKI